MVDQTRCALDQGPNRRGWPARCISTRGTTEGLASRGSKRPSASQAGCFSVRRAQDVVAGRIRRPLPRVRHSVGRSESSAGEVAEEFDIGGLFSPP
jgi:hypothetical protein